MRVAAPGQAPPAVTGLNTSSPYQVVAGQTTTVTFQASDPDTGNTVTISGAGLPPWATLTQTTGNPATATLTLSPPAGLPSGDYGINIDALSNSTTPLTGSQHIQIHVTGAPGTTLDDKPAATVSFDRARFGFSSDVSSATFECSVDGGAWAACTSPVELTGVTPGAHQFRVRAVAHGMADPTPAEWTWTRVVLDLPLPVSVTAPADLSQSVSFAFAGDGGFSFECRVDGGNWTPCTSPFAPQLPDGTHTVGIRQIDGLGNASAELSRTFTLDTTAPAEPAVVAGPTATTSAPSATVVRGVQPGAMLECRLDGGAWAPCSSSISFEGLGIGRHVLELRQTDAAGNQSRVSQHVWTVEAATRPAGPPKLTAVLAPTVAVIGTRAELGCRLSGVAIQRCRVGVYVTLADGKQKLIGSGASTRHRDGRITVRVTLNRTGRRYVQRAGGVRATFKVRAAGADGRVFRVTRRARILPTRSLIVAEDVLFATRSDRLSETGRRYLRSLAARLDGVRQVRCVGHTDAHGAAGANMQLGFRRAKTVCRFLHAHAPKVAVTAGSFGESRPRASNVTARGRHLNRRVELTLQYR
jgi:outer membrane protein OmpA-like peptidoglycan-associated protein